MKRAGKAVRLATVHELRFGVADPSQKKSDLYATNMAEDGLPTIVDVNPASRREQMWRVPWPSSGRETAAAPLRHLPQGLSQASSGYVHGCVSNSPLTNKLESGVFGAAVAAAD